MPNCDVCGKDLSKEETRGFNYLGSTCSDECRRELAARAEHLHGELLQEPLDELPTELSVPDFERWALKLAVHAVHMAEVGGEIEQIPRYLRLPEIAALAIKERIIGKLPEGYVSSERSRSLFGPDYLYRFHQPIPRRIILEAAVDAGLLRW